MSNSQHVVSVVWAPDNHGYPYRALCVCGWRSLGYTSTFSAQIMGDDHSAGGTE